MLASLIDSAPSAEVIVMALQALEQLSKLLMTFAPHIRQAFLLHYSCRLASVIHRKNAQISLPESIPDHIVAHATDWIVQ